MRSILRGAAIGLLAGVAFFFIPFLFQFFLFLLVATLIIRLMRGGRRGSGRFPGRWARHGYYGSDPIPIDGYPGTSSQYDGPVIKVPVL